MYRRGTFTKNMVSVPFLIFKQHKKNRYERFKIKVQRD